MPVAQRRKQGATTPFRPSQSDDATDGMYELSKDFILPPLAG